LERISNEKWGKRASISFLIMNKRAQKPSPLGEVLEKFFSRSGLTRRLADQKILDSWKRAVGRGIAEQTQPLRIQNRVLQVRVSNSVWMQQLQFMKGMILQRVREETGVADLVDLRLFLGEVKEEDAVEGGGENREEIEPKTLGNLTESEKERIRKGVAALSDPEMRKIFESVFSRGLAIGKTVRSGRKQEEE
jgi:hypothetical protein